MAHSSNKTLTNVPGRYYVDDSCVDCGLCPSTAPDTFRRDDVHGVSIVYHQPLTPEELEWAEDARTSCPTESIGKDGEG